MVEQCPVQTSAVYVMGRAPFPAIPPPSPPSPMTPAEDADLRSPIEELCLDDNASRNISTSRLAGAVHVLNTEATTLQCLAKLYATDATAGEGFSRAVSAIAGLGTEARGGGSGGGRLTVIGVGKSGHIAKKLVATFNSLGVRAQFLHPTEALHGDLGQIGPHDALMLVTFSGNTPELLLLLPHLDRALPLILLTSHTRPDACELARRRPDAILLPAPVHEPETVSFGISAPTSSTTAALAVGDALALVAARELHPSVAAVFARNHPGGAIGAAFRSGSGSGNIISTTTTTAISTKQPAEVLIRSLAAPLADMPCLPDPDDDVDHSNDEADTLTGADLLRAAYAAPSGWVRLRSGSVACPSRLRALSSADLSRPLHTLVREGLVTRPAGFVGMAADTPVQRAVAWIRGLRAGAKSGDEGEGEGEGEGAGEGEPIVVAVLEYGLCVAVMEVDVLLAQAAAGV